MNHAEQRANGILLTLERVGRSTGGPADPRRSSTAPAFRSQMAASAPRVAAPNDAPLSVFRLTAPLPGSQPPSGSPARLMPSMSRARTAVTAGFDVRYTIAT